jgi:hypothetical protein
MHRLLFDGQQGRTRHKGLASFLAEVMRMQLADKDPGALQERRMVEFLLLSKQLQQLPEEEEVWKVGMEGDAELQNRWKAGYSA